MRRWVPEGFLCVSDYICNINCISPFPCKWMSTAVSIYRSRSYLCMFILHTHTHMQCASLSSELFMSWEKRHQGLWIGLIFIYLFSSLYWVIFGGLKRSELWLWGDLLRKQDKALLQKRWERPVLVCSLSKRGGLLNALTHFFVFKEHFRMFWIY